MNQFYTAESVTEGHPDKLCDLIADSVLDECLSHDALSRVACEVMATRGQIIVAGEITSLYEPSIPSIVRSVLRKVGYNPARFAIQCLIHKQSPDIAAGVDCSLEQRRNVDGSSPSLQLGAGDQGIMVGYACSETSQMLPLPVVLAHRLTSALTIARKSGAIQGLSGQVPHGQESSGKRRLRLCRPDKRKIRKTGCPTKVSLFPLKGGFAIADKPRLLDSAAKAPKTAMKDAWLKSKEKAVSELKGTPFASQQGETSNAPANSAGDQMLSGIETTAKKSANITYRGGKKLAQTTARKVKEKREISRTLSEAKNAGSKATEITKDTASKIRTKNTAAKAVKGKPQKAVKTASRSMKGVKNSAKGIKTAQHSAKTAQQAAKTAQKTAQATAKAAQKAAQAAKATAKATIAGVKAAVRVTIAAVKATIAAVKGLIAAIAAGGWVAVVIILLICLIALIVGSCFGLFFGSDSTGTGTSVTQAVTTLNGEFQAHIQEIEDSNSHDRVEFTSNDGVLSINWEDVLAVFSAKVTGAEDGAQVASLDDTQVQQMRDIMWEMNAVSSSTRTESHEVEVTEVDEDGKETTRTETVTETILEISLTHKTAEEMAQQYNFNARQNEYFALMSEPENQNLWAELLGGFSSGGGQIMNPNTDWEGTGIFQWPLPQSYTITSWFGYREDPFTGEIAYHSGTDIGAPGGTPILAAADGTVTIANAIDSWGGGYGYHIKISHNDTFDTLYAHCSSICVTVGQEVKQGEVIGYVGTTGNSTGNHLHFEVWQNGERTDALGYFKAKG